MIPKIVHYCWLSGDKYPDKVRLCMESWKKQLPGWEFRLWGVESLQEIASDYAWEAYRQKKYAFAADVVRVYAVYKYGGFYLDTDVEVLKDLNPLLGFPYVFGMEKGNSGIEAASFGAEPGCTYLKKCLDYFRGCKFEGIEKSLAMPVVMRNALGDYKKVRGLFELDPLERRAQVLPWQYFSPKSFMGTEKSGWAAVTDETYTYHHFLTSWLPFRKKLSISLRKCLGPVLSEPLFRLWAMIRK